MKGIQSTLLRFHISFLSFVQLTTCFFYPAEDGCWIHVNVGCSACIYSTYSLSLWMTNPGWLTRDSSLRLIPFNFTTDILYFLDLRKCNLTTRSVHRILFFWGGDGCILLLCKGYSQHLINHTDISVEICWKIWSDNDVLWRVFFFFWSENMSIIIREQAVFINLSVYSLGNQWYPDYILKT